MAGSRRGRASREHDLDGGVGSCVPGYFNNACADLGFTNITGAKPDGTNLSGAYMASVNLSYADLTQADLIGATLKGITWTGATCPNGAAAGSGGVCSP